jgi:prepilin-type N-terminal cleavage/methylation domain-containing protein
MKLFKKLNKKASSQDGFTLIELLVVIGILAILLAITLIAINPNKDFQDTRNAKRQSDVSAILDAIYDYESANNGKVPPALTYLGSSPVALAAPSSGGTTPTAINLCGNLAPTFLADLPMDPSAAAPTGAATPCAGATTAYNTGYMISESAGDRFTVTAPDAEDGASISVTR